MTKVKICGLRDIDDALAAAEAGADFLGIVFEPRSRRYVDVEEARLLVRSFRDRWGGDGPRWVGVFANQSLEEVKHVLSYCDLDMAQLSGSESTDFCRQVNKPVIKVLHVRSDAPAEEVLTEVREGMALYRNEGHMCMLDTFKQGILGGTGQVFDWDVARTLAREHQLLLAGGLNRDNVAEAVRDVRSWGLDVSSGVETDGRKDAAKIVEFIEQVRRADESLILSRGS